MDFSSIFIQLYNDVLEKEKNKFHVRPQSIRDAIRTMTEVYMPKSQWEAYQTLSIVNYNEPAERCAYVHKYALLYTGMVCDLVRQAIRSNDGIYQYLNSKRRINLCSLGGGPGTDVVGSLAAFYSCVQFIPCSVTILDYAKDWKTTFSLVTQELRSGPFKALREMVKPPHFDSDYMDANLMLDVASNPAVRRVVASADFLTMVKFISAAACKHTRKMVQDIFNCMREGALLLFIDNAAGGFLELMQQVANQCGMISVFGPLCHYEYENPMFKIVRFGYTSQSKTKIAVQMWKKPQRTPYNATHQLQREYFGDDRPRIQRNENIRFHSVPASELPRRNGGDDCNCSII